MFTIIGVLCTVMLIGYLAHCVVFNLRTVSIKSLKESDLVKKFNKTLKKLTERNIDTVKEELLSILNEYRNRKCQSFIESKKLLEDSSCMVRSQIVEIDTQIYNLKRNIKTIKSNIEKGLASEEEQKSGTIYLMEYEKTVKMRESLEKSESILKEKLSALDYSIETFNHRYSLKKSEITVMIANAAAIKNVSSVDIKLNDLVSEFESKVREEEIKLEVTEKIFGSNTEKEIDLEVSDNYETYLKKLKTFSD